eukprot:3695051-Rhodomonas_salina.5
MGREGEGAGAGKERVPTGSGSGPRGNLRSVCSKDANVILTQCVCSSATYTTGKPYATLLSFSLS